MRTIFQIFILLVSAAILLGCNAKANEAKYPAIDNASAHASEQLKEDARVAKKARLEKEAAIKAEQRSLAMKEKIKASLTYKDEAGRIVFNKAEVDPTFSGGTDEMRKYLQANLKYPALAKEKGFEGTVYVDFVIDKKGKVREVLATDAIGEDVNSSFKEESVRVVAAMPLWHPGTQHGKAVDAAFSIPITFEIR
jgi:TonB family protein